MRCLSDPRDRDGARLVPGRGGSVLLLSMRRLADLVAFCLQYEFEDVVAEVTGADRVEAGDHGALEFSRRAYKLARAGDGLAAAGAGVLARGPPRCGSTGTTSSSSRSSTTPSSCSRSPAVPGWRRRCRVAACFVSELWVQLLPGYLLELLAEFDHVFLGVRHPVGRGGADGRTALQLPSAGGGRPPLLAAPRRPPRVIDVCNIGRRSPVTHEALLRLGRDRRIFYYYDTVAASGAGRKQRTFRVDNAGEHRLLLASLLQRSRYFIANRGRVNEPEFTTEPGRDLRAVLRRGGRGDGPARGAAADGGVPAAVRLARRRHPAPLRLAGRGTCPGRAGRGSSAARENSSRERPQRGASARLGLSAAHRIRDPGYPATEGAARAREAPGGSRGTGARGAGRRGPGSLRRPRFVSPSGDASAGSGASGTSHCTQPQEGRHKDPEVDRRKDGLPGPASIQASSRTHPASAETGGTHARPEPLASGVGSDKCIPGPGRMRLCSSRPHRDDAAISLRSMANFS